MLGFEATLRNAGETAYTVLADHGRGMVWNTFLALVPLALALVLFRPGRARSARWWCGVLAFVLFLPNAPYVLSDVIHFFEDVRRSSDAHNLRVAFVVAPIYATFFAIGFGSYVGVLHLVRRYVGEVATERWARAAVLALHMLSSIGVFVGRFWRFNSWDVVTAPDSLAARLDDLTRRWPLLMMAVTFVSLLACTTVAELLVDGFRFRRQRRRVAA